MPWKVTTLSPVHPGDELRGTGFAHYVVLNAEVGKGSFYVADCLRLDLVSSWRRALWILVSSHLSGKRKAWFAWMVIW